ncbi:MAG: EAL domain-containing protein [Acidiferrobacteraceae bacterium]
MTTLKINSGSGQPGNDDREISPGTRLTSEDQMPDHGKPSWRFWGLRARLLLLVALAVLPALAVIGYTANQERARAMGDAQEQVKALARAIGRHEARRIRATRRLLSLLARLPQVRLPNSSHCHPLLATLLADKPQYANFALIASDNRVLCSAVKSQRPVDPAREAFFRRVFQSRRFSLGNYQVGQMTGLPVLVAAYPLRGPEGRVTSLLIAAMKLTWLKALPVAHRLPAGATLVVLDPSHDVLFHYPGGQRWIEKRLKDPELQRMLRAVSEAGVAETRDPMGQVLLDTFSQVRGFGSAHDLDVILRVPARIAYAKVYQTTRDELLVLMLTTGLVFLLAWVGGTAFMMRPIGVLLAATRRLATGDLTARTEIPHGTTEIGQLAANFDEMAGALERRTLEILDRNQRVGRLNRVHRVLSGINSALLRIRERDALLQEVCRIAVDQGGFRLAWIGIVHPETSAVVPKAWAGPAEDYVQGIDISTREDVPEGQGPISDAVRSGKHTVCNDMEHDPRMLLWRERKSAFGLGSMAAFPLQIQQHVVGAIALYAGEPGFFDSEELRLLEELAANAGLGLEYIDQEHQLRYLAYYDPLTGLANRTLFHDRLGQVLTRAQRTDTRTAVLAIEMVQFRKVLDTLGRQAGDSVLRETGARLTRAIRANDTVARVGTETIARLGGDAFALLLADIKHPHEAETIAQRLLKAVRNPVIIGVETVVLDARAGIALGPQDSEDPETLLAHAELALHSLTTTGQEQIRFYAPEMNVRTRERHKFEQNLRQALERGEFMLHYQPQVELTHGAIVGTEALLRWQHPEKGLVSPAAFIPILEDTGLIIAVGDWVLRTACTQQVKWKQATGVAVNMAINISAHQFRDKDLPGRIRDIIGETGIDPNHLELEITESVYMDHADRTLQILDTFKSEGIRLSIDDFGTGYCSLGYLREFPVDILKIDQSFVKWMTRDPDSYVIARSVVALAHGLGMRVIAEGVETEGQLRLLAAEGCDDIQGYFFSRPVPASEILHLLRAGACYPLPMPVPRNQGTIVVIVAGLPDTAVALERALGGNAHRIVTLGNTEEAFEALAINEVAAIVAGPQLPGVSGEEFMRRVRGIYPSVTRILLVPEAPRGTGTRIANPNPVAEYISVPLDQDDLSDRFRRLIPRHRGSPSGRDS